LNIQKEGVKEVKEYRNRINEVLCSWLIEEKHVTNFATTKLNFSLTKRHLNGRTSQIESWSIIIVGQEGESEVAL
jgi:hypothetical protein